MQASMSAWPSSIADHQRSIRIAADSLHRMIQSSRRAIERTEEAMARADRVLAQRLFRQ
jgi:hypothetical protein